MPLPMVHVAIAVQLGTEHGQFPSADFLLGSVAPDAIHMRPNSRREDKQATHLMYNTHEPDEAGLRSLLAQYAGSAFATGYAAHVLTDHLWIKTVIPQFRSVSPTAADSEAERVLYYRETDQIDVHLYRQSDWQPQVWTRLAEADCPDFPPLLTAAEIHQWRERTLHWFDDPSHDPQITPQYLTVALVQRFVQDAAEYVAAQFIDWHIVGYR